MSKRRFWGKFDEPVNETPKDKGGEAIDNTDFNSDGPEEILKGGWLRGDE